jgi:uncharacterized protein YllA (UPF0747 family)
MATTVNKYPVSGFQTFGQIRVFGALFKIRVFSKPLAYKYHKINENRTLFNKNNKLRKQHTLTYMVREGLLIEVVQADISYTNPEQVSQYLQAKRRIPNSLL